MKRRIPEYYTVWITRTGQAPKVVSIPAKLLFAGTAIAVAGIIAISSGTIAWWQARQQQQQQLHQEAQILLEALEGMESELDRLRERSGLESNATPQRHQGGKGGRKQRSSDTRRLLAAARDKYATLSVELEENVEPALERTLAVESALPQGVPLTTTTHVTSEFGVRRNPFGFAYEFHDGIDFAGDYGTPVYATAPGTVTRAGWSNEGYGKLVEIEHPIGDGRTYYTRYAHLADFTVKVGDRVDRSTLVGQVGSTGRSTAPHLHYAVYVGDRAVNPRNYLDLDSVSPIASLE